MPPEARDAQRTTSAGGIDFAGDTLTDEALIRTLYDVADKLMTEDTAIAHVSADEFEISAADTSQSDPHQTLTRNRARIWIVAAKRRLTVKKKRTHAHFDMGSKYFRDAKEQRAAHEH
jgi:hypothetical protein